MQEIIAFLLAVQCVLVLIAAAGIWFVIVMRFEIASLWREINFLKRNND
jgi:hypothetical protein